MHIRDLESIEFHLLTFALLSLQIFCFLICAVSQSEKHTGREFSLRYGTKYYCAISHLIALRHVFINQTVVHI